jgi:hypothetical protein
MLKLVVAVLAVGLASTASAAKWRDLRVDASSEAAFQQSVAVFDKELSSERRYVFQGALMDIWILGTRNAKADQREFTVNDYYQQLHGLSYEEVVTFTDPTGDTAKARQREAARLKAATAPVGAPAPLQGQYHASPEARTQIAHDTLDHAELMRTRNGTGSCGGNGGACPPTTASPTSR